ncbi:MAG: HNH endonuclease signature motif containing protein [Pseudomonadota bacterium]
MVKAWVLNNSNGVCEGCKSPAPFEAIDGFPYLEVHHIRPLAEGGSDTIFNTAALCPNCHRRCHVSSDRQEFSDSWCGKIIRPSAGAAT